MAPALRLNREGRILLQIGGSHPSCTFSSRRPCREGRLIPGSWEGRVERWMSGAYSMPCTLLVLSQIHPQSSSWVWRGSV